MRLVKLGIGNVNSTVGAVTDNVRRLTSLAFASHDQGASIVVFPEQVIGGYSPEDLVQWRAFVDAQWAGLQRFAEDTISLAPVFVVGLVVGVGGDLFNCAAVVHGGVVAGLVPKEKLPTYNVFYEARTLSRGARGLALQVQGVPLGDMIFESEWGTFAVEVCEDIWSPDGPMRRRCYSGAEVVCNVSASPYRAGVLGTRREMIATRASDNQTTLVYANLVGANDGLIFDGGGYINQNGRPIVEAPRFVEGLATGVVDLDRTTRMRREASTWRTDLEDHRLEHGSVRHVCVGDPASNTRLRASRAKLAYPAPPAGTTFFLPGTTAAERSSRDELLDDLYEALALGVADYFRKTGAFRCLGLALSGGRDSLLTLLVAHRAAELLHPELHGAALREKMGTFLHCFFMPTRYSSSGTAEAARTIASDLGAAFTVLSIEDAFDRELDATRAMLASGSPSPTEPTELTKQNVQARIRGQRMWNWSNTSGALFLQTGNMSEKSLGYTTVGGDLEGALSVIANLPKTVVIALIQRLFVRFGYEGIAKTLATTAGPELAANQSGEAELMPFEVLDACLHLYGAEKLSEGEVAAALPSLFPAIDPAALASYAKKFATLFTRSIYKWVQAPLTLHVGSLDLDRERALQLPVVQRTEWGKV